MVCWPNSPLWNTFVTRTHNSNWFRLVIGWFHLGMIKYFGRVPIPNKRRFGIALLGTEALHRHFVDEIKLLSCLPLPLPESVVATDTKAHQTNYHHDHWHINSEHRRYVVRCRVISEQHHSRGYFWTINKLDFSQIQLRNPQELATGVLLWLVCSGNNFINPDFISFAELSFPRFAEPIPNNTVTVGRDALLACVVENLKGYKVIRLTLMA